MELTSASSASESTMYRMAQRSKRYWHHMTVGGAAMKLNPSASYQRGGYNSNQYQPFTLCGPVIYGRTPGSEHYQDRYHESTGKKGIFKEEEAAE